MKLEEVSAKVNTFGLSLLSAVHTRGNGEGKVFISPLSVASALGMVSLGATPGGKAQHELLGTWSLNSSRGAHFLRGLNKLTDELVGVDKEVRFLSANSVWCAGSIKDAFQTAVRNLFNADAKSLPHGPDPINTWCSKATDGMISKIIDDIDPQTVAILVNAVYFKGEWAAK